MKLIYIILAFNILNPSLALINCSPADCTAGCDSSCQYQVCDKPVNHMIEVKNLPIQHDVEPSDACSHSTLSDKMVPFIVDGVTYSKIPANVSHKYLTCSTKVNYGPACPPPPPPAKPVL